jgi:RNA-directed DNA polymerase
VLDRFVQQAVLQVFARRVDRTFSNHSYGFRPGRSAHQAVAQARQYIAAGYRWCVDLDLEKFFDRASHDQLMARIETRAGDRGLLKLIRAFLKAGVVEGGLVSPVDEGTPQGGPLSPSLRNIVLDEFGRDDRLPMPIQPAPRRTVRNQQPGECHQRSGCPGIRWRTDEVLYSAADNLRGGLGV